MWKRLLVTAVGVLILGACASWLNAAEKRAGRGPGDHHEWMEMMAKKLGLSDDQKAQMKTIHEKYQPQYEELFHKEREEMKAVLTPEQQEKAKAMFKEWKEKHGGGKEKDKGEGDKDKKDDK